MNITGILVIGEDSNGLMHVQQIVEQYKAQEAAFEHKTIIISINRSAAQRNLYDAVRYAWKVAPKKASRAEIVVAVVQGIIRGVLIADANGWVEATTANFPGREPSPGRYGFTGREAPPEIVAKYCGHCLPACANEARPIPSDTPCSDSGRSPRAFQSGDDETGNQLRSLHAPLPRHRVSVP